MAVPSGSSAPSRKTCCGVPTFQTIEELRQALLEFRQTYNKTWLIERHGFLTPVQFRQNSFKLPPSLRRVQSVSHKPHAVQTSTERRSKLAEAHLQLRKGYAACV